MDYETDIVQRYVALGNEFGSLMFDLIHDARDTHPELHGFSSRHFSFCIERINSILLLLQHNSLWDAEILARPLIECTVRLCYVCYAPAGLQTELIQEYDRSLYEINRLEQSERAKKTAVSDYPSDGLDDTRNPSILSEDAENHLRSLWPKSKRQALKQKWSFSEMVRQLGLWTKPHFRGELFSPFIFSYGISSHLIHADESGMGVVQNRNEKEPDEIKMVERAHLLKLLNLILTSSMLMTTGLAISVGIRVQETLDLINRLTSLQSHQDPLVDALMEKWKLKREALKKLDSEYLGVLQKTP
jgi:hypothetical protein